MTVATRLRGVGIAALAPNQVTGLAAWYKADALGLADGAAVATWPDASGNGRDLTQANAGARPTHETNELNSLPVVRFAGTGQFIQSANFGAQNQPTTILIVARDGSATGTKIILDGMGAGSSNVRELFYVGGASEYVLGAGGNIGGHTADTSPHVFTVQFGATDTLHRDGVGLLTGNAGADPLRGVTLGCYADGLFLFWQGDIAEVAIWFRALSTGEVRGLQRHLGAKYAVAVA